jgi:hypothetical protein
VIITDEMREECLKVYESPWNGGRSAVDRALDALAAMPEPGCEGCKYESMEVFGCRDCTRRMRDHYTPKEAGK